MVLLPVSVRPTGEKGLRVLQDKRDAFIKKYGNMLEQGKATSEKLLEVTLKIQLYNSVILRTNLVISRTYSSKN